MMKSTKVIWFTGLSGSGKSTIAELLAKSFEEKGMSYTIFDGDAVRDKLHKHLGFTKEDILENNRLILELCKKEFGKVDFILVPIISPFRESRDKARKEFKNDFLEVYLDCPYEECKKRDVKGHYGKAESGQLSNFIGLHIPYEKPSNPEVKLDVINKTPEQCVNEILNYLVSIQSS